MSQPCGRTARRHSDRRTPTPSPARLLQAKKGQRRTLSCSRRPSRRPSLRAGNGAARRTFESPARASSRRDTHSARRGERLDGQGQGKKGAQRLLLLLLLPPSRHSVIALCNFSLPCSPLPCTIALPSPAHRLALRTSSLSSPPPPSAQTTPRTIIHNTPACAKPANSFGAAFPRLRRQHRPYFSCRIQGQPTPPALVWARLPPSPRALGAQQCHTLPLPHGTITPLPHPPPPPRPRRRPSTPPAPRPAGRA